MAEWRFIARRAVGGAFLDLDLDLNLTELAWTLSGPGVLRGTLDVPVATAPQPDGLPLLQEWGTLIYAESGGVLRWGGIVTRSRYEGGRWSIEAAGFSAYPHGIPYEGTLHSGGLDAFTVVRAIWGHLQSYPDADLGVRVTGTGLGPVGSMEEPYTLAWWDAKDCGGEIDNLAKETPFDYVERVEWAGDNPVHYIDLTPRAGRKRDDLVFIVGDNVLSPAAPESDGDDFANEIFGLGAGEGSAMVRRATARRDGRLRRARVYTAKDVDSPARLDALIRTELEARSQTTEISSVLVTEHPNASIGSWQLGDDVLIEGFIPWVGEAQIWHRIVGWSLLSTTTASLTLVRSSSVGSPL